MLFSYYSFFCKNSKLSKIYTVWYSVCLCVLFLCYPYAPTINRLYGATFARLQSLAWCLIQWFANAPERNVPHGTLYSIKSSSHQEFSLTVLYVFPPNVCLYLFLLSSTYNYSHYILLHSIHYIYSLRIGTFHTFQKYNYIQSHNPSVNTINISSRNSSCS